MPEPYVPALGRISGKLLQPNLTRNGSDLTFRNRQTDDDLLYLDVSNLRIGINTDTPSFDLTVSNWTADSQTVTTNLKVTAQTVIADFIISASDITTQNDPIEIVMTGNDPAAYFDRLSSDGKVVFDDNKISGDGSSNIEFDAAGTGKIELLANTVAHSDVNVTGTIELGGNLSTEGDIIIGDSRLDRVIVNTDLTQDILPGATLTYNLGASNRRWSEAHVPNWTTITNLIPSAALVSEQTYLGGPTNLITTVQSNEDLILEPGTGILYVDENFKLETVPGSPDNLLYVLENPNAYGSSDDNFGTTVDISESYTIVGAYYEDDAGGSNSGKAYIFSNATGNLLHTLDNPNAYSTSSNDFFGNAVSISESYAIVGAYQEDDAGGFGSGKAYIFDVITGSLLHTLDNPNAYSTSLGDFFGDSVDISESYAIVGAYQEDDAGGSGSGKAYIFDVTDGSLLHTLNNPNAYSTSASDNFGVSVAISETYAIVGAYQEDDASGDQSGKAYIFDVITGSLLHTLDNPNAYSTSLGDFFGDSVDISESYAIVGAYQEDDAGGSGSGKAYIFDVITGSLLHILNNPNSYGTSANDWFGSSVAISETHAVVGAYLEDDIGVSSSGRTYVYNIGRYDTVSQTIQVEYGAANNNSGSFTVTVPDISGYDNATVIIDSVDLRGDFSTPSVEYIELKLSTASTYDTYTSTADDAIYRNYAWISGTPQIDESNSFTVDFQVSPDVNVSPTGMPDGYFWQVRLNIRINAFKGMTTLTHPSVNPVSERFGIAVSISGSTIAVSTRNPFSSNGEVYIFGAVNAITNLSQTLPVIVGSTGNGYTRFVGTNGMVIPAGTSAERTFSEVGETRWNTEEGYLECYDGNVYIVATGPGETVTTDIMTELAIVRSLILG